MSSWPIPQPARTNPAPARSANRAASGTTVDVITVPTVANRVRVVTVPTAPAGLIPSVEHNRKYPCCDVARHWCERAPELRQIQRTHVVLYTVRRRSAVSKCPSKSLVERPYRSAALACCSRRHFGDCSRRDFRTRSIANLQTAGFTSSLTREVGVLA